MKYPKALLACAALLGLPLLANANTPQAPTPQQQFENGISSQKQLQQNMQQNQKLQQQQLNQQLQQRNQQLQQQRQQQLQQDLQRSQRTTPPPPIKQNP
jgi:TolA-binding protein